ncbi:aspartic peptidase domain-containing protein, partial [Blyttiomyces helicus]
MYQQSLLFGMAVAAVSMAVDAAPARRSTDDTFSTPISTAIAPLQNFGWDGYYAANVTVGTSANAVTLPIQLDTGSNVFWINGGYVNASDYENTNFTFNIGYADGSGSFGNLYCGGFEIAGVEADAESGCFGITDASSRDGKAGMIGLMRRESEDMVDDSFVGPLNLKSFGMYLSHVSDSNNTGTFSINGIDPAHVEGPFTVAPPPIVAHSLD